MFRRLTLCLIGFLIIASYSTASAESTEEFCESCPSGTVYYVRQTVGNDANDGLSPETAWKNISKLSGAMSAGDTAYIGPGLYRDSVIVLDRGEPGRWMSFIADTTGQYTGDPPGIVMITGAEPVDEDIFEPHSLPGVYVARELPYHVLGMVEMDGDQYRYWKVKSPEEVAEAPARFFYDKDNATVYVHTSDGKAPAAHDIEFFRRNNGIFTMGSQYVQVIGFTFRHMGDAGINFFKGSSHGIAVRNTSYGGRQGIRVYNATDVYVYGNTLFRNENCGVYFAKGSAGGSAVNNVAYENIKGVRWSSASNGGMAVENILFDNHEAGVSVESVEGITVRYNTIVGNEKYQILSYRADYDSDDNCFAKDSPDQLIADFSFADRYMALAEYQKEMGQDLNSIEGNCGALPEKIDVHRLNAETKRYTPWAREKLGIAHNMK